LLLLQSNLYFLKLGKNLDKSMKMIHSKIKFCPRCPETSGLAERSGGGDFNHGKEKKEEKINWYSSHSSKEE